MRRSFGGGGGGMGGGNGGGGSGMLRTVQRAVRAGVGGATPEPFSPSSNSTTTRKKTNFNKKTSNPPNTALTLSSSIGVGGNGNSNSGSSTFSSLVNFPVSAASGAAAAAPAWGDCTSPNCSENLEWECVDGSEDEMAFYEDFVFGTVPSTSEVHHAVSALQQVLGNEVASPMSVESEMDWIEPSLHLCNSNMLQSRGSDRVYDAFHLLQTEPSVQRMVISLSSDKAVWDAVLNNELVKELRGSIQADEQVEERERSEESDGDSNPVKDIMSWIIVNAREKIMQLIDNITKLVTDMFQPGNVEKRGGTTDTLEEKLKTSLFLSIVVLLIVVVTRTQRA